MGAMTERRVARSSGPEHANAVRRLAGARDEQGRLGGLCEAAAGSRAEPLAEERLSAARAHVASREEWLHWIEEGESLAPWADGEWGPNPPMGSRAAENGRAGREPFRIQARTGRRGVKARALARSAQRIRASERRIEAATALRDQSATSSNYPSSAGRSGRSHDA